MSLTLSFDEDSRWLTAATHLRHALRRSGVRFSPPRTS